MKHQRKYVQVVRFYLDWKLLFPSGILFDFVREPNQGVDNVPPLWKMTGFENMCASIAIYFLKYHLLKAYYVLALFNPSHAFIPYNNPKNLVQMKFKNLQMKTPSGKEVRNLAKAM